MNSLDVLLAKQRELMVALGIDPKGGGLVDTGVASRSELGAAIGMVHEAAEVLEGMENANKVWKHVDDKAAHVKEELIDVLFFTLELAVLLNLSGDDLTNIYRKKYKKNLVRLYKAVINNGPMTIHLSNLLANNFTEGELEVLRKTAGREDK